MAIGITARVSIASNADATSYATAAFTPTANELLIGIANTGKGGSIDPSTPTVSGQDTGSAWQLINNHFWDTIGATRYRLTLHACITGPSPGSAAVTFSLGGVTHPGFEASVFEISGADEGNGVAQTFVQVVETAIDLPLGTSASVTLAAAGDADNRPFSAWGHQMNQVKTPRTNWTEIHDVFHALPDSAIQTQWRSDTFETTASSSWATSTEYGGFAFEIKALVAAGSLLLRRNPMRHMLVR